MHLALCLPNRTTKASFVQCGTQYGSMLLSYNRDLNLTALLAHTGTISYIIIIIITKAHYPVKITQK